MAYNVKGGCVSIEFFVLGGVQTNCYIISDGSATFVVDPAENCKEILKQLNGRKVDAIVLTHQHFDHVGAAKELREATGATVIASALEAPYIDGRIPADTSMPFTPCPIDHTVADKDVLKIGNMAWKVIVTPGHTKGGICLFLDPEFGGDILGAPVLVSGDTLFYGSIGRTDFEGGSISEMRRSLKRLAVLPDETIVLPGHSQLTTIGDERIRVFAYFA